MPVLLEDYFNIPLLMRQVQKSWFILSIKKECICAFNICTMCYLYCKCILKMPVLYCILGGACGVMVIIMGNGHGDTTSTPRGDWLHFT